MATYSISVTPSRIKVTKQGVTYSEPSNNISYTQEGTRVSLRLDITNFVIDTSKDTVTVNGSSVSDAQTLISYIDVCFNPSDYYSEVAMGNVENESVLNKWGKNSDIDTGGGQAPITTFKMYSWSRVTLTRYQVFDYIMDTDYQESIELTSSQKFPIGGREVVYITASTDTNNTKAFDRFSGVEKKNP